MTNPTPTIDEALALSLAEQRDRIVPRTYRQYESIVDLLKHRLNGYAYELLDPAERWHWSAAFDARGTLYPLAAALSGG